MKNEGYQWNFSTVGGVTRVNITSGEDIAHLNELDQKLWTVLSCPVKGLEFDSKTLSLMDYDHDGKIRVQEILSTAKWLTTVLKDPELLLKKEDFIPLSNFNTENEEGKTLLSSARQILSNLSLKKESISLADASDSIAIFAKTRFNGDGVITEETSDDPQMKKVIASCISTVGSTMDRSGLNGVTAEQIEAFYAACSDYSMWKATADALYGTIFPYGENTEAALKAVEALQDKIADYFMRCKLVSFNSDASDALDVSVDSIQSISSKDLSKCAEEISSYPLARIGKRAELPLDESINPAWQAAFASLKSLVLDIDFPKAKNISEEQWNTVMARFNPYKGWISSKKGEIVESLGLSLINEIIAQNHKEDLLQLVAMDKELEKEAGSIQEVEKLLLFYRDFYQLLCNFVTFSDFYSTDPSQKGIFQAGTLFIDQRSCSLCIKVSDMANHNTMAPSSGMFLIYCNCVSKVKNETMTIVAAMTQGDINELKVGKNAIFYDRSGQDWDATVTKIIDNPISIRQSFWSPYRKFGQWVNTQINKIAADKDSKMFNEATSKTSAALAEAPATAADSKKQAFDIAKFCGIFAAIGMALGYIGSFLVSIFHGFISLTWWQMPLSIVALMLVISGPSMFIAYGKLRRRNLSPLLNANGWAINSQLLVNIRFGGLQTNCAKLPKIDILDPFAKKKMPAWKKALYWIVSIIVAMAIAFGVLYFTNNLKFMGLQFSEEVPATEEVIVIPE